VYGKKLLLQNDLFSHHFSPTESVCWGRTMFLFDIVVIVGDVIYGKESEFFLRTIECVANYGINQLADCRSIKCVVGEVNKCL